MRTMYDSVTPEAVPTSAQMVAGYIDGHYRSFSGLVQRCPNAVHIPIAVFASTNGGLVLDVESGDATPAQAPGWVKMRAAAGVPRPTVYTLASWAPQVKQACSAAGLAQHRDYELWIAHYDGRPSPDGYGEVAKQYMDHGPNGENYDLSAVFDDAWPLYAPAPPQEEDVPRFVQPNGDPRVFEVYAQHLEWVPNEGVLSYDSFGKGFAAVEVKPLNDPIWFRPELYVDTDGTCRAKAVTGTRPGAPN